MFNLGRVEIEGVSGPLDANQYEILLEPTDQSWAFALEDSVAASPNIEETDEDLFRFRRPADTSVRYRLALQTPPADSDAQLSPAQRRNLLQLPASGNPRARALADELRSRYDDRGVAAALLQRFREQPYFYTLRPPAMPDDGIDALLFDVKRGFCAHYAGAMAFVLRSAGIPARIVVGYQGGESGAGDEYLIVRQYDAHAWVEGWFEGAGWIRLDPTAAIAPSRIESGLREAMAEEGSFLENSWLSPQKYGNLPLLTWASLQLDRVNYQWQRWVVGYQGQSQMDLLSRLPGGLTMRDLGYISAGTVAAALLFAGLISAWRGRQGGRHTGVARQLQRWQRFCEGVGVPVRRGETPLGLAERLARAEPALADSARVFAGVVNTHYYSRQYSRQTVDAVAQPVSDIRLLRRLLARMKRQRRQAGAGSGRSPAQSSESF
ncbi:MAG: transglutaminase-like domain-containing protein [Marinobacter sp.]|nr:transglutaminase-like domain-containing protein [Marinobacter sp.]